MTCFGLGARVIILPIYINGNLFFDIRMFTSQTVFKQLFTVVNPKVVCKWAIRGDVLGYLPGNII